MQTGSDFSNIGVRCNVLPLHFLNRSQSRFLWLKTSIHQNSLVAKHEDGSFSILTVRDKGNVCSFVLDPNLRCVYWNNESASQQCQLLYAQSCNGDVLLYGVDEDGVTEVCRVSHTRILNLIKTTHPLNTDWTEKSLELVGCDQGQIVLHIRGLGLFSVTMTTCGDLHYKCNRQLPHSSSSLEVLSNPSAASTDDATVDCYQIVNGCLVIVDPNSSLLCLYTLKSGQCVSQIDLRPLSLEMSSVVAWRISNDLNELMFVLSDWLMVCINIEAYSSLFPACCRFLGSRIPEQMFNQKYLSFNLCRYGDATWKQEVVNQHIKLADSNIPLLLDKPVIGFNIKKKTSLKHSASSTTMSSSYKSVLQLETKEQKLKWKLKTISASNKVLILVLSRQLTADGRREQAVCLANYTDNVVNLYHLTNATSVVLSDSPTCCLMLLSDEHLMFVSSDVKLQKDDLIAWMMSYSGASVADSLCQANQWTRTAVPLQLLKSSLRQRQLDTLAFYFKSKRSFFSAAVHTDMKSIFVSELRQLEDALNLVTSSVTSSVADPQGKMFAERLLSLTLNFVYGLLEETRQVPQNKGQARLSERDVTQLCNVILVHLPTLRKCMYTLQYKASPNRNTLQVLKVHEANISSSLELTLEHSIQDNCLSSYQAAVMSTNKEDIHYRDLIEQMIEVIKLQVENKDISLCQHLLKNLGCDAKLTVWTLGQFCASRSLQQFVMGQLSAATILGPSQREVVQFLGRLYQVYPCASFNAAMRHIVDYKNGTWPDKEDALQETVLTCDTFMLSHCGELSTSAELSTQHGDLYAALLLAWLADWSEDMKRAVLLDAHFLSKGDAVLAMRSEPTWTWQYLISHNSLDKILSLLKSNVSKTLPGELTNFLHLGWSHLRNELAKELLRLGQLNLTSAISQDIDISAMLPLVGDIMRNPHPVLYVGSEKLTRLHVDFITNCVSAGLQLPLWMYCFVHGLNLTDIQDVHQCSWLPLFQLVYSIPRHPTDRTVMLAASLLAASELWPSSSDDITIELMLERNQSLAAVGSLCYMPEAQLDLKVSTIERCLHKYPKLVLALLPDDHESAVNLNTTVYQLLMGAVPFELRRLFGWHSTNSLAREDSPKTMPHFSESHLKMSHCRHKKLSFPYYLKHGRPVFAFLSFLSEELDRGEATLSLKRIQQACGAALWIACEHFQTSHITSSCVVFVELLGRDSALVRSMIHVGRLLFTHRHRNVSGGSEAKKEQLKECVADIVSELQACVRSHHRHGNKLIKSLEDAIIEEIKLEGIGSCSFEASNKWTLAVIVCKLLGLPLSTRFLQLCADSDNWLMFVWFAQLHQYPTHQLQVTLHSFQNGHVRDHLYYVLNNADCKFFSSTSSSSVSSTLNAAGNERTSQSQRTSLYNKIGLQRSRVDSSSDDEQEVEQTGHVVISSFSSRLKQTEFDESEMPESTAPEDVFRMLFYSSSMPSQWKCLLAASVSLRNPLFAELAACCGCPAIPSLCGWLLASLNAPAKENLLSQHGQQVSKWTMDQLEAVISATLMCGEEDSLTTAFSILQSQSPLLPFLNFVTECVKRGNYASCKTYVDQFKDAMAYCDQQKGTPKMASDLPTVGDRLWFEKITYEILKHELAVVGSLYHARHLLQILDKHNFCLVFGFDVLDFAQLHKIVKILHANQVPNLHLPSLFTPGTSSCLFLSQCEAAIEHLIQHSLFSPAKELAKVAGIHQEKVILCQLKEEKKELEKCGAWTAKFVRAQYWDKCVQLIKQAECSSDSVACFFQEELRATSLEHEKAGLCQHWLTLLEGSREPAATKDRVFTQMWTHRIAAKVALEEIEPLDEVFGDVSVAPVQKVDHHSDILHVTVITYSASDQHDLSTQELEVLDSLMGNYLDKGRVSACTEVAAVFGHYNQDLAIIQTCIALATRHSSLENIEPAMKRLIAKSSSKRVRATSIRLTRSFSITSISSTGSDLTSVSESQEVTSVMEKLYVHCDKGSQVCLRIITCFKIAQILGMQYEDIVRNSPFDSLRQLLRINDLYKFALAKDFLSTSGLSDDEVSGFLADSIVEVLKVFVKENISDSDVHMSDGHTQWIFNPSDGMQVFSQFLKLCDNIALLGDRILQTVASLLSSGLQGMTLSVLTIQTELIIMAHECYTVSSNMEGISHVLRAARVCCHCITEAREFTLMIRLLTGVGRYSEMLYIFHALQKHHQFELLLCKGMDREDKLKVAILDYLKRYQPDDNEAYTMVALKFTMYRDIAAMLEACGYRTLKLLKENTLDNSKETHDLLRKCLQYFRDAAESYVKDNSMRKSQVCARQARLISLQLQLVSSGTTVINLNREQVATFVNTHGRFIEAMVVSDAYERRADWAEALYNNVVINGDMCYLQEMRLHVHITSALVEDVVNRYKQGNTKSTTALTSIKKLLPLTKDAQLQYRLACELGLADVITTMLKGDTGSYLQDITAVV